MEGVRRHGACGLCIWVLQLETQWFSSMKHTRDLRLGGVLCILQQARAQSTSCSGHCGLQAHRWACSSVGDVDGRRPGVAAHGLLHTNPVAVIHSLVRPAGARDWQCARLSHASSLITDMKLVILTHAAITCCMRPCCASVGARMPSMHAKAIKPVMVVRGARSTCTLDFLVRTLNLVSTVTCSICAQT